jgi:hypothetical protein
VQSDQRKRYANFHLKKFVTKSARAWTSSCAFEAKFQCAYESDRPKMAYLVLNKKESRRSFRLLHGSFEFGQLWQIRRTWQFYQGKKYCHLLNWQIPAGNFVSGEGHERLPIRTKERKLIGKKPFLLEEVFRQNAWAFTK